MKTRHWHTRTLALACAAFAVGCADDAEVMTPTSAGGMYIREAALAANPELSAQLAELRKRTAKYHDFKAATDPATGDYPALVVVPGLTSPDGCVSDAAAGGMGYHYAGVVGIDDEVDFRTPELLVYTADHGPAEIGDARARLAAFDYFIPYSAKWPQGGTAPTSADMGLAIDPAIEFAPSRFGGWMFHIWLWEHNPHSMFANWNPSVPLCDESPF